MIAYGIQPMVRVRVIFWYFRKEGTKTELFTNHFNSAEAAQGIFK